METAKKKQSGAGASPPAGERAGHSAARTVGGARPPLVEVPLRTRLSDERALQDEIDAQAAAGKTALCQQEQGRPVVWL